MRKSLLYLALFILSIQGGSSVAASTAANKKAATRPAAQRRVHQVTGRKLLGTARLAVAGILKSAQTSQGRLDSRKKRQAPFWIAVGDMDRVLRSLQQKVARNDKTIPATLSQGSRTLARMKVVWPRIGVKDPRVSLYIVRLDNAYVTLRSVYGAEGARARQGGTLTAAERKRLQDIQAAQVAFAARLAAQRVKARQRNDRATEQALARMIGEANRIAAAQLTVDSLLAAQLLLDDQQGEWRGYSYWVPPDGRAGWKASAPPPAQASATPVVLRPWDKPTKVSPHINFQVPDVKPAEVAKLGQSFRKTFPYQKAGTFYIPPRKGASPVQAPAVPPESRIDVAALLWRQQGLDVEASKRLMDSRDQAQLVAAVERIAAADRAEAARKAAADVAAAERTAAADRAAAERIAAAGRKAEADRAAAERVAIAEREEQERQEAEAEPEDVDLVEPESEPEPVDAEDAEPAAQIDSAVDADVDADAEPEDQEMEQEAEPEPDDQELEAEPETEPDDQELEQEPEAEPDDQEIEQDSEPEADDEAYEPDVPADDESDEMEDEPEEEEMLEEDPPPARVAMAI